MAYRSSGRPLGAGRGGGYASPPYTARPYEADTRGHEVPYYQDPRDMRRREYYDTYAFATPSSYTDWIGDGQPARSAPSSSMPRPRADHYRPSVPQYSSFSAAGPSSYSSAYHGSSHDTYPQARSFSSSSRGGMPTSPRASYVPPHKRGQPSLPSPAHSSPQPGPSKHLRDHRAATPPFVIPLPDREYMNLSKPHIPSQKARMAGEAPKKLLVLDLNGTLIFRNKNSSNSRTAYPRPYLKSFLEYLLQKEEEGNVDGLGQWSVFVWSSAQPHNVRGMLESTFDSKHIEGLWDTEGPDKMASAFVKGKVLGVWARDKMGLSEQDYAKKTQTVKDLRNVAEHFTTLEKQTNTRFRLQDILLLDDSPKKAVHQPWNQLVLPEYDKVAWQQSREAISRTRSGEPGSKCDQYLLAIVGILEDLTTVSNIPAYIRAGGLKKPSVNDYAMEWASSGRWQGVADGPAADEAPSLEQLPTHSAFKHWFQDQAVVEKWIARGKETLEKRGIVLEHGVRLDVATSPSPAPFSSDSTRRTSRAPTPGHTVPSQRRRGYSPSQPQPTQSAADAAEDEDLAGRARSLSFDNQSSRARSPITRDRRVSPTENKHLDVPPGHTRPFSTSNPNPNIDFAPVSEVFDPSRPVDTWRTLRSADVSRWLADIADRASSLDQQARNLLLYAGELVGTLGTDETWDRRMPDALLRMGGWHDDMTNQELASIGEVRALSQTKHMVEQAAANGMPPCATWQKYGSAQLPGSAAQIKRHVPEDAEGQPVMTKKKAKLVFDAVNAGDSADEVVERAGIRPQDSWPTSMDDPQPGPLTFDSDKTSHITDSAARFQPSARTSAIQDTPNEGRNVEAAPSTRLLDTDPDPRSAGGFGLAAPDRIDGVPLDYPSSRMNLPPCKVNGVALTAAEMAQIFHQASQSHVPKHVKRLEQIRVLEGLVSKNGRSAEKNLKDRQVAQAVRDTVVRIARNIPSSAVTSDPIPISSDLDGTSTAGLQAGHHSAARNGSHWASDPAGFSDRPEVTDPSAGSAGHMFTNGDHHHDDDHGGHANRSGDPYSIPPAQSVGTQRPFNYRWCVLDLPPCRIKGKVIGAEETARMYEKARKRPTVAQQKTLSQIRSAEDRVNNPNRTESAREADMKQVEMLRNTVIRLEGERERSRAVNGAKKKAKRTGGSFKPNKPSGRAGNAQ